MYYRDDRFFTDEIHRTIAVPLIYSKLGWFDIRNATESQDNNEAIDYVARNFDGNLIYVQERFRRIRQASEFSDITIRYQRPNVNQRYSEFFKMFSTAVKVRNYFMIYGVISGKQSLQRCAVVDLNIFFEAVQDGTILIGDGSSIFSKVENGIVTSGLSFNKDRSSSFVSFDVNLLKGTIPKIVILSQGF